jgi:peptidyl-prolyl cis-trans isomerase D
LQGISSESTQEFAPVLQQMRSAAKWIWLFVVAFFVGGFLLFQTSGLMGREKVTSSTVVATVNGVDIPYLTWANLSNSLAQQQEASTGHALTLDERHQVEDQAFEQLVSNIVLEQEYRRRGIRVSDEEVIQAAQLSPPPEIVQNPEFQTDGRFDIDKWQRFLKSPAARQGNVLLSLEDYYRTEIPRSKLFDQIASDVYVPDAKLWSAYRDGHDSAQVSYVTFDAMALPDSGVQVTDEEIRQYYERNKKRFERGGRAILGLLTIPRSISAADSAAARARALKLRDEIVKGATFEDVARRESADSVSAAQGGLLGVLARGRFVPDFEKAAFALKPGELSQPVLTSFGYHLIRVEPHKGDSTTVSHILVRITQNDSSAVATDRMADTLARIAASSTESSHFDSAAKVLGLKPEIVQAYEGQPLLGAHGVVPSVSAWAFSGVRVGETSDLYDSDDGYFLARLDTLYEGGTAPLDEVRGDIRAILARRRKTESLVPKASELAKAASSTSLEAAAKSHDVQVTKSPTFSRSMTVPGLGRLNEAIGAAFTLPVGVVSAPVVTDDAVYVMRVDKRVNASRDEWEKQKTVQRSQLTEALRQTRLRDYLDGLRKHADVKDKRKALNAAAREQGS